MAWDPDALARLERIPPMARGMARRVIEEHVRAQGETRVTAASVRAVGQQMGMGGGRDADE